MSWLRLDDGFPQHPKLAGWTASQKWALIELFTYCARQRTEGHVPTDLSLLPRAVTKKTLQLAEESGILDRAEDDSLIVHDWSKYNPSDSTAAERMKRMRERNARRNNSRNASSNEIVSSRGRLPSPSPEKDLPGGSSTSTVDVTNPPLTKSLTEALAITRFLEVVGDVDEDGLAKIRGFAARLPEGSLAKVAESIQHQRPRNRVGYAIAALNSELRERA